MALAGKPYDEARARYVKGHNLKQISVDLNLPYEGLVKQCQRKGWDNLRTEIGQSVDKAVQSDFRGKAGKWLAKVDEFVNAGMARLDPASLTLKDLAVAVGIAESCDRMARRAYGLDEDKGNAKPASLTVNVAVTAPTGSLHRSLGKVVDVESSVVTTDPTALPPAK